MREFFNSWRRQVGVVTLLMTLIFTGGWLRSFFYVDSAELPITNKRGLYFGSLLGHIAVLTTYYPYDKARLRRETMPTAVLFEPHDSGLPYDIGTVAEYVGFHEPLYCGFGRSFDDSDRLAVVLPYWFIVLLLTVISYWLLDAPPAESE